MKFDLQITISRLLAFLMIVFGFVLSLILKESAAFVTSCSAAGVIVAIKTGFTAYGESKKPCSEKNKEVLV